MMRAASESRGTVFNSVWRTRGFAVCVFASCGLLACVTHPKDISPKSEGGVVASSANLKVELVNVKLVDGKYRYFCSIHNAGSTPFSGSLKVESVNRRGEAVGGERFTITTAIEPGLRRVVYLDQHTGPPEVHGDYGITSFRITAE